MARSRMVLKMPLILGREGFTFQGVSYRNSIQVHEMTLYSSEAKGCDLIN